MLVRILFAGQTGYTTAPVFTGSIYVKPLSLIGKILNNNTQANIDIISVIWTSKWLVMSITAIFAILSLILALNLTNVYRADALLAPVAESNSSSGLSALSGQFGGLASLAGINLGGVKTDKTLLAIEYLRSRTFLINFIQKHQLKIPIMAASGWNRDAGLLEIDPDIYDEKQHIWTRNVEPPKQPEPSDWEVYEAFLELITVEQETKSGLVSLSIEFYSPDLAQQWINLLVADLNHFMREKDTVEASKSIAFLQQQITQTTVVGVQEVIYGLIEEQLKTKMLAEVREEYVFNYVDPPLVPEQKFKPRRAVICIVGVFSGGLFSIIIVLSRAFLRSRKQQNTSHLLE